MLIRADRYRGHNAVRKTEADLVPDIVKSYASIGFGASRRRGNRQRARTTANTKNGAVGNRQRRFTPRGESHAVAENEVGTANLVLDRSTD